MGLFKRIGRGIRKAVSSPVGGLLKSVGQVALNATGIGGIINTGATILGGIGSGRKDSSKSSGGQPVGNPMPVGTMPQMNALGIQPQRTFMQRLQSLETTALAVAGGAIATLMGVVYFLKK